MGREEPTKKEGEPRMGNKRVSREVLPRYVVDTYDDGKEQKWCKGCGGIFFAKDNLAEVELNEKHSQCDPSKPEGGVEKFLEK